MIFVKILRLACIASLAFMSAQVNASEILQSRYVDDPVNYLGSNRESIERKLTALENKTGYRVLLTTRSDTELDTLEEFGAKEFRKLMPGPSNKSNGILFLIITEYKNVHVEVGPELQGLFHTPSADKEIQTALALRDGGDTGGAVAERGIDAVIKILEPSLFSSLVRARTGWLIATFLIVGGGLSVAILFLRRKRKNA
jgi:uncharacterized membrane protein YgcG